MTESTATLASRVMRQSPQLVVFCLLRWTIDSDRWRVVVLGLRNPSLSQLKVQHCRFLNDAGEHFLNDMHASNVDNDNAEPHQQVHSLSHLELSGWGRLLADHSQDAVLFSTMLCGSLLQHVTLDSHTVGPRDELAFFNVLATDASVGLRSLELKEMSPSILWNIAPYVASAKHLQDLVIEIDNRRTRTMPFTTIANAFLSALRRNSSLHRVEIRDFLDPNRQNDTMSRYGHLIQAYTTRNRVLPELATKSFVVTTDTTDDTDELSATAGTDTDEATTATGSQFPTLCQVSQPAPRLIPSTVLKGLMATSQEAVDSNSISGSGGESEQIP
jgi:hypothetical protein